MDTVKETLERLEKSLLEQISILRGELTPLERELANVRRAKSALPVDVPLPLDFTGPQPAPAPVSVASGLSPYAALTMKQLTIKALTEHFPDGVEALELLDFFHNAWGRKDIKRSSLSPQLSRLKNEGDIELKGRKWLLKVL